PAFDVQVGIVAGAQEGVNDLRPVRLAESGKTMFRHARMADTISFEQRAVDVGVLGVNVKNFSPEFVDVGDRINELEDQMAGVPFDAEVFAPGGRVTPLPP